MRHRPSCSGSSCQRDCPSCGGCQRDCPRSGSCRCPRLRCCCGGGCSQALQLPTISEIFSLHAILGIHLSQHPGFAQSVWSGCIRKGRKKQACNVMIGPECILNNTHERMLARQTCKVVLLISQHGTWGGASSCKLPTVDSIQD